MKEILRFQFKGERNYNQGGDIFDLVDSCCSALGMRVRSIIIKRFTSNHLELFVDEAPKLREVVARGKLANQNGELHDFSLYETDLPVKERREFDEDSISDRAVISGDEISLRGMTGYSLIEHVIALTKKLNYTLSPLANGKWIFAQLQLTSSFPEVASNITIVRESYVANRFSRNRVVIDGAAYGIIQFVVV